MAGAAGDRESALRRWLPRALTGVLAVAAGGLLAWRGLLFARSGGTAGLVLGAGVLVVLAVGVAATLAEIRFGVRSAELARRLEAEGGLPEDLLPRRPSGRIVREAADEDFDRWREQARLSPQDWRVWYRLALAYDAARDRRRARAAVRRAIAVADTRARGGS